MKNILSSFCLIVIFISAASAQTTYQFLRMDVSPRASAMGGSLTAADDDPDVMFYNPAGIAFLSDAPMSLTFVDHLLDIKAAGFSASYKFEDIGRFGVGIKYVNYGSFTGADEFGNRMGTFNAGETALQCTYANFLDENFAYGASAQYIYSGIAEYSSSGLAFDLGLNYAIPDQRINIGFSALHLGTQLSSYAGTTERLPVDVRLGASKGLQYLPLKFFVEFQQLNGSAEKFTDALKRFTFGGEFTFSKYVKARIGFDNQKRTDLKIGNFAGLAGFSFGLGINVSKYTINYSFSSLGQVGGLHRFGINANLLNL